MTHQPSYGFAGSVGGPLLPSQRKTMMFIASRLPAGLWHTAARQGADLDVLTLICGITESGVSMTLREVMALVVHPSTARSLYEKIDADHILEPAPVLSVRRNIIKASDLVIVAVPITYGQHWARSFPQCAVAQQKPLLAIEPSGVVWGHGIQGLPCHLARPLATLDVFEPATKAALVMRAQQGRCCTERPRGLSS